MLSAELIFLIWIICLGVIIKTIYLLIVDGLAKRSCPICREPIWRTAKVCPHCHKKLFSDRSIKQ